jgi:FkbM family methyltransferase
MDLKTRIKLKIKKALLDRGYRLDRVAAGYALGYDAFPDMVRLTQAGDRPTVFDIGANLGQTVGNFRLHFRRPVIHSFEPGEATFQQLKENTEAVPDLSLNKLALGSRVERRVFLENEYAVMSSFLEPDRDSWGKVTGRTELDLDTLDNYCSRASVASIDILKTDTQGFDLEVLRGSVGMLGRHRVHLIFMEVIFSQMYKGQGDFEAIYHFLRERGFSLVSLYSMYFRNDRLAWADALFVDPEYHRPA